MADYIWFDPTFGAAGNMVVGALIAMGADISKINAGLELLEIDGLYIRAEPTIRGSLSATHATVESNDTLTHRPWTEIDTLIANASLPEAVANGARRTFRRLGEVEAGTHGVEIDDVHFHEVGALDAIADIVGSWLAWYHLGEPTVWTGTFGLGHGRVEAIHGTLPLPAPAVVALLQDWAIQDLDVEMETVTPTGAALLTTLANSSRRGPPPGIIIGSGRGAGSRDPGGYPNVLSAIRLSTETSTSETEALEVLVELTTNLDDVTGEILAHTINRCLAEGAADAWVTPIIMKKGRPAHTLTTLCSASDATHLRRLIMAETGTLGVRQRIIERFAVDRGLHTVYVEGHAIKMKVGPYGAKPEYDDVLRAAEALQRPARQISMQALLRFTE